MTSPPPTAIVVGVEDHATSYGRGDPCGPAHESGTPTVSNMQLSNNGSIQVGPFNTSGTYHLYCTVHQNMNLTVQVQ